MIVLKFIWFLLVEVLWQLPQSILGAFVWAVLKMTNSLTHTGQVPDALRRGRYKNVFWCDLKLTRGLGLLVLGQFIFVSNTTLYYSPLLNHSHSREQLLMHVLSRGVGYTHQSRCFGWFYLPLLLVNWGWTIAIQSRVRTPMDRAAQRLGGMPLIKEGS